MKKKTPPRLTVSLAIPTYNREAQLIPALKRAFALRPRPDEILLIDQTPSYGEVTRRFLERAAKDGLLRRIRQDVPNLPVARGRAVKETKCDIILFIDDDVVPDRDLIGRHLLNYSDPTVDVVAVRVEQTDMGLFPHKGNYRDWPRLMDPVYFSFDSKERVEGLAGFWGTSYSARIKTLRSIGAFDGNYVGSARFEDADTAVRIWKKGGKIVYDPRIRVRHLDVKAGGTRVQVRWRFWDEWLVSFSTCYFAFRYYFPSLFFWYMTLGNLRRYVLRVENYTAPWRIPWALAAFGYAWIRAALTAFTHGRQKGDDKGLKELQVFSRALVRRRLAAFFRARR